MFLAQILAMTALGAVAHPIEITDPLHNPGKGWVLIDHAVEGEIDAGRSADGANDGTVFEWYQGVAILSTWAHIETNPGVFDWTLMDRAADYWAGQGKRLHLRFCTEDFGNIIGCPRWLFEMGAPRQERPYGAYTLPYPDYNHPIYQERLRAFLKALADKYADDPRVDTVNLQGYGNWGEWHSGYAYANPEDRVRALRSIVDAWREAFAGRKPLNLSCTYEWRSMNNSGEAFLPFGISIYDDFRPSYDTYRHLSAFDYAHAFPDINVSRHGVAGAVKMEYDGRLIANFFQHYRKPLFMEFFGGPKDYTGPSIVGFGVTKQGEDHIPLAVDDLLTHHPNYASPMGWGPFGGATDFYNKYRETVLEGHELMGYRFVVIEAAWPDAARPGGVLTLRHTWENRALGRCYRRYPLAVSLVQGDRAVWQGMDAGFDPTSFIAGGSYDLVSRFTLPADLPEGEYNLRLALLGEDGQPAIRLAIAGAADSLWYPLGALHVNARTVETPEPASVALEKKETGWTAPDTLDSGATALVSFSCDIATAPERDLDTQDPGFFRFYAEGTDGMRIAESRWYEKPGYPAAPRTHLVAAGEAGPYHLKWDCVGGGTMAIGDVRVEKLDPARVRRVNVETPDVILGAGANVDQRVRVHAVREQPEVKLPADMYEYLSTDPARVAFAPNTTYTVWFHYAARPQLWRGDYHYFAVRSASRDAAEPGAPPIAFHRIIQRHTAEPIQRAYTFTTGGAADCRLAWGIKNGGEGMVSGIVIVRR